VKSFLRKWRWNLTVIALVVAMMPIPLTGCFWNRPKPPIAIAPREPVEVAPTTTTEHGKVEDAQAEVDRLRGELKEAESKVEHAKESEREARLAGVRMLVTWATAIFALVGILSIGAFVFVQMKSLLLLAGACAAMIAAAQATNLLLDHPLIAGTSVGVVVLAAVGIILWKQRHTESGLKASVLVAEALKPDIETESKEDAEERRRMQTKVVADVGNHAMSAIEAMRKKVGIA
jgi:hypothetical protein